MHGKYEYEHFCLQKKLQTAPYRTFSACYQHCVLIHPDRGLRAQSSNTDTWSHGSNRLGTHFVRFVYKMINPLCAIRGAAVWGSSGIIYMTGWFLGVAGVLMNASIELTTIGFDSQIYADPGRHRSVWTAFRDIANIVIIGMFTFIALTMILGIEKFNARQMVAKSSLSPSSSILASFSRVSSSRRRISSPRSFTRRRISMPNPHPQRSGQRSLSANTQPAFLENLPNSWASHRSRTQRRHSGKSLTTRWILDL